MSRIITTTEEWRIRWSGRTLDLDDTVQALTDLFTIVETLENILQPSVKEAE